MPGASDTVDGIARCLAAHAGLELPAWVVEARSRARAATLGLTLEAYLELIDGSDGDRELDELIEAVRVGETRLFRHRAQIAALADVIAPGLRGKKHVRVWSAGCAGGEEPYTLAAVLAKALPHARIEIIATDVSADALAVAERASYPAAALADVPDAWRDAFVIDGDRLRVSDDIAALVRFERANLVEAVPPRDCDLVWCRNVLIYFTPAARAAALERLVAATVPGGAVFVGYSESLRDVPALEARRAGDGVYYVRRHDAARGTPLPAGLRLATPPTGIAAVAPLVRTPPAGTPALARPPLVDELVLAGAPDAGAVQAAVAQRLASPGLVRLVIDLDQAELLADELAAVLRRARAAARSADIEVIVRATKPGARRWVARHGLGGR